MIISCPSAKAFDKAFPGKGKELKAIFQTGRALIEKMEQACQVIDGYGSELLPVRQHVRYVNMGDPYATTILAEGGTKHGRVGFRISIGNWGDKVESGRWRSL